MPDKESYALRHVRRVTCRCRACIMSWSQNPVFSLGLVAGLEMASKKLGF